MNLLFAKNYIDKNRIFITEVIVEKKMEWEISVVGLPTHQRLVYQKSR